MAGEPPLDRRTAFALGVALGEWARKTQAERGHDRPEHQPEVIIGMDTRESGPWLAASVAGGLKMSGVVTRFAGIITTPGVAYLARTGHFVAGVMISASHNPYRDNGIKVIDHSGYKLADAIELKLETRIFEWLASGDEAAELPLHEDVDLEPTYSDFLARTVTGEFPYRLVIDCANGSATRVAQELFPRLGAQVTWIGNQPNGRNINLDSGSLHLESLRARVLAEGADLGVAFDGDADRALFVARSGRLVDGDAVLFLTGTAMQRSGHLTGSIVVATVMSNLGLEKALQSRGIQMIRTPVGDKYVLEEMLKRGAVLGGEQSGHVIFTEFATTGDGLLTALRVLQVVRESGKGLDELISEVETFPQKLVNVRVKEKKPLSEMPALQAAIAAAEKELDGSGRVLVRFSGTEPLARVMIEADSMRRVDEWTARIVGVIVEEMGGTISH